MILIIFSLLQNQYIAASLQYFMFFIGNSIGFSGLVKLTRACILVFILLADLTVFAQREADNWILGHGMAITFKSGKPEKIPTGQWPTSAEIGASVASDGHGNLLFYTDALDAYDRNHQKMPHGDGLKGHKWYAPSCQIVPKPGDPNRYYIFTTHGVENGPSSGAPFDAAHYSEVDLCLNGGLGDVIEATKNTPLFSIAAVRSAVVKHRNGIDYWIVFHQWNSDAFYCYKVTANGLDPNPVISHAGFSLGLSNWSSGDGGQMKFSPDGQKLAMVVSQSATAEVYDFNSETGFISGPIVWIPAIFSVNQGNPAYTYGIEFSPNNELIYLSRSSGQM
ncbi:MAG TPA: hypothetical protein PLJ60_14400, partial [Chryseolinea sp.]|nr:hypothetical protein [Chryseolinea sp.]